MLATVAWKSRPIAGRAMPTTVASRAAMPDPSTVAAITHRPWRLAYRKPGAACVTLPPPPPAVLVRLLADHRRGDGRAALAEIVTDLVAEPPRFPPVDHRPGDRAGEQRCERERRPADAPGEPPGQLPGERRSRDEQQALVHLVNAAAGRPGPEVGARPLRPAALRRHAVDLMQLADQLDLDPDDGERLRRDLRGERGQRGQRGPGSRRAADGRRGPRRAIDQPLRDLVVGLAGEL